MRKSSKILAYALLPLTFLSAMSTINYRTFSRYEKAARQELLQLEKDRENFIAANPDYKPSETAFTVEKGRVIPGDHLWHYFFEISDREEEIDFYSRAKYNPIVALNAMLGEKVRILPEERDEKRLRAMWYERAKKTNRIKNKQD